jgi:hypothetical protein
VRDIWYEVGRIRCGLMGMMASKRTFWDVVSSVVVSWKSVPCLFADCWVF